MPTPESSTGQTAFNVIQETQRKVLLSGISNAWLPKNNYDCKPAIKGIDKQASYFVNDYLAKRVGLT